MRRVLVVLPLILLALACEKVSQKVAESVGAVSPKPTFNMTDKDVQSNGNIAVAAEMLKASSPNEIWSRATSISVSDLSKKTASSVGQTWKVSGEVYKVEEVAASTGLAGKWTEVLLLAQNPNSPVGSTTIDFLYNGDSSEVNSGDSITIAGYLAGSYESQNAMGGTVEALAFVGNKFVKD